MNLPVIYKGMRQSSLSDYSTCRRIFLLKDVFGIVPKAFPKAATVGSLFHLGMASYLKGNDSVTTEAVIQGAVNEATQTLMAWAEANGAYPIAAQDRVDEMTKNGELAIAMAAYYWGRHQGAFSQYEVLASELDLRGSIQGIPMGGRLDLVIRDRSSGAVLLPDFKTTKNPQAYLAAANMAHQPRIYAELLSQCHPDWTPAGFIYAILYRPQIVRKSWQTLKEYVEEIQDYFDSKDDQKGIIGEDGLPVVFKSGPRKGQQKPRWEHSENALTLWRDGGPTWFHPVRLVWPYITKTLGDSIWEAHQLVMKSARSYEEVTPEQLTTLLYGVPPTGAYNGKCIDTYGKTCPWIAFCQYEDYPEEFPGILGGLYTTSTQTSMASDPADLTY